MIRTLKRPKPKPQGNNPTDSGDSQPASFSANNRGNFHKFVALSLGLQIFTAFFVLLLGIGYLRLSSRPPVLVERTNGDAFQADQRDPDYRDPKAIQSYVETLYSNLYNWAPVTNSDKGLKAEVGYQRGKTMIPVRMAAAEFGLSPEDDFRAGVINELANDYSKYERQIKAGHFSQLINIREISEPQPLKDGGWKVSIVSDLVIASRNAAPENIPLEQTVYLRPDHRDHLPDPTTEYEAHRNTIRAYGLLVYAIRDIEVDDPTIE